MAHLPKDPKGWELEDLVAAHFGCRGCYVETGIKERRPDEILELDVVWTDYRPNPEQRHPVEIKSGEWGLGDVFKFYGWTRYLSLEAGQFAHKEPCGRLDQACLDHVAAKTKIAFLDIPDAARVEQHLAALGLPGPVWGELPDIWRFSYWAQRRLLRSLVESIRQARCAQVAKAAKEYHRLVNDAVFFTSDVRDRIEKLFSAHYSHQELALSAAFEIETGKFELTNAPQTHTFKRALFDGRHFPVQCCLYLGHRARLYLLKALVDLWLARGRGELKGRSLKIGNLVIDLSTGPSQAMLVGLEQLSKAKSFRLFPVLWQDFLWTWGGFFLKDRFDEESAELSKETGVPQDEISLALSAFDLLFPTGGGWFREPAGDSRKVLMLMPAAMRGIGAFRRLTWHKIDEYGKLGLKDFTGSRLGSDHNATARLLECAEPDLVS